MTPEKTKEVMEERLGKPLEDVFAWIDLEAPLGSASIAQVPPSHFLYPLDNVQECIMTLEAVCKCIPPPHTSQQCIATLDILQECTLPSGTVDHASRHCTLVLWQRACTSLHWQHAST